MGAPGGSDTVRWCALLARFGAEVAMPLTRALDRLPAVAQALDHSGLQALREELESARRTAMLCQQLTRLASGRLRQHPEPVDLRYLLQEVLSAYPQGVLTLTTQRPRAHVEADPCLLHSLLDSLIHWALEQAPAKVLLELHADTPDAPVRLQCRLQQAEFLEPSILLSPARYSLYRALLQQTAQAMGLRAEWSDEGLSILFEPRPVRSRWKA